MAARKSRKAARSKKRLDRQAKSEAVQRAAAREAKEAAKRKNILAVACKADVLSSEERVPERCSAKGCTLPGTSCKGRALHLMQIIKRRSKLAQNITINADPNCTIIFRFKAETQNSRGFNKPARGAGGRGSRRGGG